MTEPTTPTRRIRINVGTSVKGVKTYDATVELLMPSVYRGDPVFQLEAQAHLEQALNESDMLIAELDRRYPPPAP